MGIRKDHALLREILYVRGLQGFGDGFGVWHQLNSQVGAGVTDAHVVGHENDYVRFLGLGGDRAEPKR